MVLTLSGRHTDRQTDRDRDTHRDRQTDRQADRQTHTHARPHAHARTHSLWQYVIRLSDPWKLHRHRFRVLVSHRHCSAPVGRLW